MSFEYCAKHGKRYEAGRSVCIGCHQAALDSLSNKPAQLDSLDSGVLDDHSNGFDKRTYQREYMRKRRAQQHG